MFVSLSDNIQETFGLTPIEGMASGLPLIVSDADVSSRVSRSTSSSSHSTPRLGPHDELKSIFMAES